MIHPHIPVTHAELKLRMGDKDLIATLEHDGSSHSFPIPTGRAERTLSNALLHINAGINPTLICNHFHTHTLAESSCPCCKLEGRVLAAQGRRKASSADHLIASRSHSGGTVQVRRIKTGLSSAQINANDKRSRLFEAAHSNPTPQKIVKKRIEELI